METERIFELNIDEEYKGERLDIVLSSLLKDKSRSSIQKLIEDGNVSLNGIIINTKKHKVNGGEAVLINLPEPIKLEVEAEDIPIDIVYEDDDLLVVNKAKGMVVHPGPGNYNGTLVNAIMYHCKDNLSSINGVIRPGIVHRIDKDTSGLLMVAKTDFAHNSLAEQLANHSIERAYLAIVYNNFNEDEGTIDAPIGRDPNNRFKRGVTDLNSKRAVTHYKVLERFGQYTLIEARLETGRTHQIRVHMAHIKHPLVGDPLYGPEKNKFGIKGQMLHAYLLGFIHPRTKEFMHFESQPSQDFQKVLNILRNK